MPKRGAFNLIIPPTGGGGGGAPSGPAGGSLASTYPNPTFAGRDASVDAINKDLVPALLLDTFGVSTFPAPADVDPYTTDDIRRHDLVPAMLLDTPGVVGVSTFPVPILYTTDDARRKDLVPQLLTEQLGIVTLPDQNTLDARHKDLVPELLLPMPGGAVVVPGVGAFGKVKIANARDGDVDGSTFGFPSSLAERYLTQNAQGLGAGAGTPGTQTFAYTTINRSYPPANLGGLVSGTVSLYAVALPKGIPINTLEFYTATTAASGPQHWWMSLCNSLFVTLRSTPDQLTTAMAANSNFPVGLSSVFTTTYEGLYYIAIMVAVSTTMPTGFGFATVGPTRPIAPIMAVTGIAGQTGAPADGTNLATSPVNQTNMHMMCAISSANP